MESTQTAVCHQELKHMDSFEYFTLARSIHVVGVVIWIGGVAFVTTILIPSLKNITDTGNRLELFEQLEGKICISGTDRDLDKPVFPGFTC